MKLSLIAGLGLSLAFAAPAFAHIALETRTTPVGAGYKAVLKVPHGCDGAATTAIKVLIPDGFIGVKPMPKPGWTLAVKTGDYKQSYKLFGTEITSGVTEIDWTGGDLPDAYYDEFVMAGQIAGNLEVGSRLYFPVVQECGDKAERWIMIPSAGEAADDLETPAPALTLAPAAASH